MTGIPRIVPRTADEVLAAIVQAQTQNRRLSVCGGGSKRALFAGAGATVLDLGGLSGIVSYQPEELVLTVRAGTPLDYVEALLAENRQMLAFEPPHLARRLGTQPARSTIGGVIGSGWAGPRRLGAGNVRDHLLGFEAVSGRGERFRAGGRVIKNVTGYDLPKLMAGSWGTLAVLTEVTLRVLPRPQFESTLLVQREDLWSALADLRAALATPLEVSCAAHLPDGRSALRLEGFRRPVEERMHALLARFADKGRAQVVGPEASAALWRALRDLDGFAPDAPLLWCVSLPAAAAAGFVQDMALHRGCEALIDWGGSRVWLALDVDEDVHAAAARCGGHAWLVQAPDELRVPLGTAPRLSDALAALSRRVKQAFDPDGVLGHGPYPSLAGG